MAVNLILGRTKEQLERWRLSHRHGKSWKEEMNKKKREAEMRYEDLQKLACRDNTRKFYDKYAVINVSFQSWSTLL